MPVLTPTSPSNDTSPRLHPGTQLLRISGYLLGLVGIYAEREQLFPDTWLWLTLPKEAWHPSVVVFNSATLWEPFALALLYVFLLTFLIRFLRSLWIGTLRDMRPWLLVRAVLLGLSFLLLLLTSKAVQAGHRILDTRTTDVLTNLRPSLSQTAVEMLILQANLAMLRPQERNSVEGPDYVGNQLYRDVLEALDRTGQGESIANHSNYTRMYLHGRLFRCEQKDGKTQENTDHNRALLCVRSYLRGSDQLAGYRLLIKFDTSTLLQSARYVGSSHHEGCQLFLEIPPTSSKTYPAVCSLEEERRHLAPYY